MQHDEFHWHNVEQLQGYRNTQESTYSIYVQNG